jgi:queuine/archaeosine tRNA-ribosyltransferase
MNQFRKNPMQFYVIAPMYNLSLMEQGDCIFVLAHLWLQSEKYRTFILEQKKSFKRITLDNSAAERALVEDSDLIKICLELMPHEVIAPDVLFDSKKTLKNLSSFVEKMRKVDLLGKINIFAVPQGNTREEWLDCYQKMLENEHVSVIGLSKIAVPKVFCETVLDDQNIKEGRHIAYDFLRENNLLNKPIHCLGQGDPTEFLYYDHPMMRSTDSVYPVFAANKELSFEEMIENKDFTRIPTPHDYLLHGNLDETNEKLALKNIEFLQSCCRYDNL